MHSELGVRLSILYEYWRAPYIELVKLIIFLKLSWYIAEFYNTVTNLSMILPGLYGMYTVSRDRLELRWDSILYWYRLTCYTFIRFFVSYFMLFLVGVGSTLFHMTLQWETQITCCRVPMSAVQVLGSDAGRAAHGLQQLCLHLQSENGESGPHRYIYTYTGCTKKRGFAALLKVLNNSFPHPSWYLQFFRLLLILKLLEYM